MKKVLRKNKQLVVINVLFTLLVVAQETHLIGIFTPIVQTLIAIGSLIIIVLTIEAKLKERNEKTKK